MARIVMDAASHQAIREAGAEARYYRQPDGAGQWRGLRLTGLRALLDELGHAFDIAPVDDQGLADAELLIVASRTGTVGISARELDALGRFVGAGGRLWLMGNHRHFIAPQQRIASALGLPIAFNDVTVAGYPKIGLADHAIARDCSPIHVRNACSLKTGPTAFEVGHFMVDPAHLFAATCVTETSRILVTADSGFVASRDDVGEAMFETGGNRQFAANAIGWLLDGRRPGG